MNILLFDAKQDAYRLPSRSKQYIHIVRVLRLHKGDSLRIASEDGYIGTGIITRCDQTSIEISAQWETQLQKARLPIDVLLGHPRPIVLKRLIKDLTSIGIANLHLVQADLSESSYRNSKVWVPENIDAYQKEGAMQAGVPGFMGLQYHHSVQAFFAANPAKSRYGTIVHTVLGKPQHKVQENIKDPVLVCIGPERGWSDREAALLEACASTRFSFGDRILRTETACIGAVMVFSHYVALGVQN